MQLRVLRILSKRTMIDDRCSISAMYRSNILLIYYIMSQSSI